MSEIMNELYSIGLIPVIKIENADDAVPLAKALIDGGLPAAEITFRTASAAEAIKNITTAYPDMLVGAGTVLTVEQVDKLMPAFGKRIILKAEDKPYYEIKMQKNGKKAELIEEIVAAL